MIGPVRCWLCFFTSKLSSSRWSVKLRSWRSRCANCAKDELLPKLAKLVPKMVKVAPKMANLSPTRKAQVNTKAWRLHQSKHYVTKCAAQEKAFNACLWSLPLPNNAGPETSQIRGPADPGRQKGIQEAPQTSQQMPKRASDAPKSAQEASKKSQGTLKGVQKPATSRPREPQTLPK